MTMFSMFLAGLLTIWPAIASAAPVGKAASPFNGEWRIEYSCEGATGIYAERCAAGQHDFLELQLSALGNKLCGTASATAQLGNHVDGGTEITGTIRRNVAEVNWDILGSHGGGTVTVHGQTLIFHRGPWTADDGALWSFPPAVTTTLRRNGHADPKLATCSSPASNAGN